MKKLIILSVVCLFAFSNNAMAQFLNTNTKTETKTKTTTQTATPTQSNTYNNTKSTSSSRPNVFCSGYINTGVIFNDGGAGPILEMTVGGTFFEHLYLAPYVALHAHFTPVPDELEKYYDKKFFSTPYIPIGANMKIFLTKGSTSHIVPYIEGTFGGFIGIEDLKGYNGFFCQTGMGVDIGMFSLGIGYNGLVKNGTANFGYIKIGVTLTHY